MVYTVSDKSEFEEEIRMNCPYCNNEMEKGLIQSPQELAWIKGTKRKLAARAKLHEGSVVLSGLSFMKGSAVVANLCRSCQKVIIDCSDSDMNAE